MSFCHLSRDDTATAAKWVTWMCYYLPPITPVLQKRTIGVHVGQSSLRHAVVMTAVMPTLASASRSAGSPLPLAVNVNSSLGLCGHGEVRADVRLTGGGHVGAKNNEVVIITTKSQDGRQ